MAPGFCLQSIDTRVTQIPYPTTSSVTSYDYSAETLTLNLEDGKVTYSDPGWVSSSNFQYWEETYSPPKKQETAKEKKIRQAAAFSMFYKSGGYTPRKSVKTIRAEQREVSKRIDKFKSLNNNLII